MIEKFYSIIWRRERFTTFGGTAASFKRVTLINVRSVVVVCQDRLSESLAITLLGSCSTTPISMKFKKEIQRILNWLHTNRWLRIFVDIINIRILIILSIDRQTEKTNDEYEHFEQNEMKNKNFSKNNPEWISLQSLCCCCCYWSILDHHRHCQMNHHNVIEQPIDPQITSRWQ